MHERNDAISLLIFFTSLLTSIYLMKIVVVPIGTDKKQF